MERQTACVEKKPEHIVKGMRQVMWTPNWVTLMSDLPAGHTNILAVQLLPKEPEEVQQQLAKIQLYATCVQETQPQRMQRCRVIHQGHFGFPTSQMADQRVDCVT